MITSMRWTVAGCLALGSVALIDVAPATTKMAPIESSTVLDPVGDTLFNMAPAFKDIILGRMTKTAEGDFELLMEMAGDIPAAPPMPLLGVNEIWWTWAFDLDPNTAPRGYPFLIKRDPEFNVYVSWNGVQFTGVAIDRRPLLTGGEAIIASVPFSINGATVKALLPSTLIGDVPVSFRWAPLVLAWASPVGTGGFLCVDRTELTPSP
jgi:hypothetical protein